jgi:hypothetical protein
MCYAYGMTNEAKLTKAQAITLETLKRMAVDGRVDVTYGGIKGVYSNSIGPLARKGFIAIELEPVENRNYPNQFAIIQ